MKFVVQGVEAIGGHRGVLSARSEVFARMFTLDTEEKETGKVKLDDVSVEGLSLFLEFLYLGNSHWMLCAFFFQILSCFVRMFGFISAERSANKASAAINQHEFEQYTKNFAVFASF